MPLVADLHIHSRFSRATSKDLTLPNLAYWARLKGVHLLATGDIAHPGWLKEIEAHLEPAEEGLFRLKPEYEREVQERVPPACRGPVRFILGGEISTIYKKNGRVRKIHHVVFLPSLDAVRRFQARLARIGNIEADGRPILGLDSRDLLEILLETDPQGVLIPAHIWTPWFSLLGSKSGFDSVEECFEDLTPHIFALETGLSSDPPMNWRVSALDRYTLVSNSDAHSPRKIGREANLLDVPLGYTAVFDAIRSGDPKRFLGTVEFFPEEGKYHFDGHRKCGVCWHPVETQKHGGRCPVCGNPVTVGVLHRVETLADRPEGVPKPNALPYYRLVPLEEVLAQLYGVGAGSKRVQQAYMDLLRRLGPEMHILLEVPVEEIAAVAGPGLAEGIARMRNGEVEVQPGFDGQYGIIRVFPEGFARTSTQATLFGESGQWSVVSGQQSAVSGQRSAGSGGRAADSEQRTAVGSQQSAVSGQRTADSAPRTAHRAPPTTDHRPPTIDLNPEQQEAVTAERGPVLIVAGPGTGKTRTLTARLAYGVLALGLKPEQVLAVTFTNRAAEEMRERLRTWLDPEQAARVHVHTFHSLGLHLLREALRRLPQPPAGFPGPDFHLLTEAEALDVLAQALPQTRSRRRRELWEAIQAAKRQALGPEEIDNPELHRAYAAYQAALLEMQAVDYGDLLRLPLLLAHREPQLWAELTQAFRWIGVDEYQDVNEVQYRLLQALVHDPAGLTVIGDPDQAIYGFRGASPRYFLRFTQDYPQAKVVRLHRNYRSAPGILAAARAVLPHAPTLTPTREGVDHIEVWEAPTDRAEAEAIVHAIERMVGGTSYFSLDSGRVAETEEGRRDFGEIAILVRLRAVLPVLQEALDRAGVPYRLYTEALWSRRPAVAAWLAWVHLLENPRHLPAWETLLAYLGEPAARRRAWQHAVREVQDPLHAVRGYTGFSETTRGLLAHWLDAAPPMPPRVSEAWMHDAAGLWTRLLAQHRPDLPLLEEYDRDVLRSTARHREGQPWSRWRTALALAREHDFIDPRGDRVHVLTLHAAKGLEFPVVFLPACEDGLLPYRPENGRVDEAEERRLFYVGMTRAQERLIVSWARKRRLFGKTRAGRPSPFLEAIPEALKREHRHTPPARPRPRGRQLSLFGEDLGASARG